VRWELSPQDPGRVQRLADELRELKALPGANHQNQNASLRILASLLLRREICDGESAQRYLWPSLSHLHAPALMKGLPEALDRIEKAIDAKEQMLIYGDYDVDGTMAVIVLKAAIEMCGGAADFHVPHRIKEGYDLRDDVIERAADSGVRLIISVDMGIRAFAPAETARRRGVDLIVTDHHLPGAEGVPNATAVVNPNQAGCEYPDKLLCGAGVALKVAQGLFERRLEETDRERMLRSFMKVVAIATVADAVPLRGENRVFAKLGLEALRHAVNPGLKALLEVAQISPRRGPTSTEVAFRIAPRINAAGRMDVARDVIELFSVKDMARARELALKLDHLNSDRQEEERKILRQLEDRLAAEPALAEAYCIVVDGEGWHRGVIGITATRVVERYHRPAVVIARDGAEAFGSGRSIRPFHLLQAIEASGALFTRFGGHSHACGFAMPAENIAALREQLDVFARGRLTEGDLEPVLGIEEEMDLSDVTPDLFRVLSLLEPYGTGNHEPVFVARGVELLAPPRIMKEKHVKLKLRDRELQPELVPEAVLVTPNCHPDGVAIRHADRMASREPRPRNTIQALGWNMAERLTKLNVISGDPLDVAFTVTHNDHPDFGGLELGLKDFHAPQERSVQRVP
jgi:single-stranded-DNA-specific exonuclease